MKSKIFLAFSAFMLLWSCNNSPIIIEDNIVKVSPDKLSSQVAVDWMELLVSIDRDMTTLGPNGSSKIISLAGIAIYESILPGMNDYNSVEDFIPAYKKPRLNSENAYIWEASVNTAMAELIRGIVPNIGQKQLTDIANLEIRYNSLLNLHHGNAAVLESSNWGRQIARAVLDYAQTDTEGMAQLSNPRPSGYNPTNGPGAWRPTGTNPGRALFPYWGTSRTHLLNKGVFRAAAPPAYVENPASPFYNQASVVYNSVKNITPTERWIAEFWSDDLEQITFSAPSRMIAIANQIIVQERLPLHRTAELYCKLGIALSDAVIIAWNEKFRYNLLRPTDYITKMMDQDYHSLLGRAINQIGIVPDYPSYPSSHAMLSSVSAGIMEEFFGTTLSFTDNCHINRTEFFGNPRSYVSLRNMAQEHAQSRVLLGVEYPFCVQEGQRLGDEISRTVNQELRLRK